MAESRNDTPQKTPWTVEKLLHWTTDYFRQAGIETARLDAEVLLAHALQKGRLDLYNEYALRVGETERAAYRELVRRRKAAEPVAYITGIREFYSFPLVVNRSVLIPRPETEHLIEYALRLAGTAFCLHKQRRPLRILDMGTGSGNISLALSRHIPDAKIFSVDLSADALAVANRNRCAQPDGVRHRVSLVQGSLFEAFHPARARFDMIVSNPPYVSAREWEKLPRDVRDYEPKSALVAGPTGCEIQESILREAWRYLAAEGALIMEIGSEQSEILREATHQLARYDGIEVLQDYAGLPRVLVARRIISLDDEGNMQVRKEK